MESRLDFIRQTLYPIDFWDGERKMYNGLFITLVGATIMLGALYGDVEYLTILSIIGCVISITGGFVMLLRS